MALYGKNPARQNVHPLPVWRAFGPGKRRTWAGANVYRAARYIARHSGPNVNAHRVLLRLWWVPTWCPYGVAQFYYWHIAWRWYPQGYQYL